MQTREHFAAYHLKRFDCCISYPVLCVIGGFAFKLVLYLLLHRCKFPCDLGDAVVIYKTAYSPARLRQILGTQVCFKLLIKQTHTNLSRAVIVLKIKACP